MTGVLAAKRMELLHDELIPRATVIAYLANPNNPNIETTSRDVHAAARALGLQLHAVDASTEQDIDRAFVPIPAEAAKMSAAERVALEKATAACKEEAKGMKFSWHWRKRQKYVQNCIIRTVNREGFSIDIWEVRSRVNMKGLRTHQPGEWGCDPMC
jgi:hypothetical protein